MRKIISVAIGVIGMVILASIVHSEPGGRDPGRGAPDHGFRDGIGKSHDNSDKGKNEKGNDHEKPSLAHELAESAKARARDCLREGVRQGFRDGMVGLATGGPGAAVSAAAEGFGRGCVKGAIEGAVKDIVHEVYGSQASQFTIPNSTKVGWKSSRNRH